MNTIRKNIAPLGIFIIFFLVGLIFIITFDKFEIQWYINSFFHPVANSIFQFFTHLAEGWFTVPLLIGLLIYNWRKALFIGIIYAVSSILVIFLKRTIFSGFRRPHGFKKLVYNKDYHWLTDVEMHANYSFPSGHTTTAFCLLLGLTLLIPNKKIGTVLMIIACLVGFSRTYLSFHFLMDLVAGSFLGVITALGLYLALQKKLKLNS